MTDRTTVVLVHPRRMLDDAVLAARRRGYALVVVPRADETRSWDDVPGVVGVEVWDGSGGHSGLTDFLVEVIDRHRAAGIVAVYEPTVVAVAAAAEARGLPGLGAGAARRTGKKSELRRVLRDAGLPTPRFVSGPAGPELVQGARGLRAPVVVKPAAGFSSAGVQRVDDLALVAAAAQRAVASLGALGVDDGTVVVEEYISGPELAVESISFGGETQVLTVGDKGTPEGPFFEESVYRVPSCVTAEQEDEVRRVVLAAHRALDLGWGPTHTEVRLGHDGTPYVLEIGARVGGSGVSHTIVEGATGVDYYGEILDAAVGIRPASMDRASVPYERASGNYIVQCGGHGTIRTIRGLEAAEDLPGVRKVLRMLSSGDTVLPYPEFSGYPAFVLSVHDDALGLKALHDHLDATVEVLYA